MRKFVRFLALVILLSGADTAKAAETLPRGLFVSVMQKVPVLSSRQEINKLIDFAKQAGIKTLFIQVYRSNQAWFPSKLADAGPYERALKDLAQDPLAFLITRAHRQGIEVHAWLNLLSLGNNKEARILQKYGKDILTRNLKAKTRIEDYKIDSQYFLEPGDPRVRQELLNIVEELLVAHPDLDGIQFDYIRYPDTEPHYGYTKNNMERFRKTHGTQTIDDSSLVWKDWKRHQVTELVAQLAKKSRKVRPGIKVSATGCMPYIRAYDEAFQNWPIWLSQGLVDFVTVMNYSPNPEEFARWNRAIKTKVKNFGKVRMGVGAYKLVASPGTFAEEWRSCEENIGRCVLFHYGSVQENPALGRVLIR